TALPLCGSPFLFCCCAWQHCAAILLAAFCARQGSRSPAACATRSISGTRRYLPSSIARYGRTRDFFQQIISRSISRKQRSSSPPSLSSACRSSSLLSDRAWIRSGCLSSLPACLGGRVPPACRFQINFNPLGPATTRNPAGKFGEQAGVFSSQALQEDTGMQIEFAASPQAAHMPAPQSILATAASTRTVTPIEFSGASQGHERAWQQVLARDPKADGRFVYAVRSTNIYCRPTCPSRRPARAHVAFFPTATAAEISGFRACKRCRPDQPASSVDPHAAMVAEAARRLVKDSVEPVRLTDLARELGIGRVTLLRAFRRVLGVTPNEFARAQRMERFKKNFHPSATNNKSITDAIYTAGFGSPSRVYETGARSLGMTPSKLRAGG